MREELRQSEVHKWQSLLKSVGRGHSGRSLVWCREVATSKLFEPELGQESDNDSQEKQKGSKHQQVGERKRKNK